MITKDNVKQVLEELGFIENNHLYSKKFQSPDFELKVDFKKEELIYPEEMGFRVNERQTCNFKQAENFVVFECVHRLLNQGYHPKHIELEPKWQVGHGASGGRADILVKDNNEKALLIIECKTAGKEFKKAWDTTQSKPTQLFTYYVQERSTQFISLYASDWVDNKVVSNYYLINITDLEEVLEENTKFKSYQDATSVEEVYQVWRDTYAKDYITFGIFENNRAYLIGDAKPSSETLKNITSKDIQGKYHEFATILRQHNVSGRENAFDKLVNLFLCKVVDEKENPDALKFYWKGQAYDNPFDFQDRLQQLYKNGMKEFLGEDITYIDNTHIDEIFKHYDLDTIKSDIKDVLREQKFFTNNDFAFIDVHNKKLFEKNFKVLLKIARMIEDISLTGSDQNQFLGDMFEGFLDQGVKQSEGQFFTPMPIVKFIINALPSKERPKVIDYACGAGHFLNEYFTVNKESQILGVEKEYRLSKVAKVSSFMYGSDMDIIYSDALAQNEKIKDNDHDVLIANPPYSVKGFLETLSSEDRKRFHLTHTIDEKSYTANNAIECFFIERAKHLLSKDGVAGIIVPSSILNKGSQNINTNKGNVYVGTREILLKYFDIVAIVEFGSGTFGKTGTNTVTLFLRRRCDIQNLAGTFAELANKLFDCKLEFEQALQEKEMLQKYCNHIEVDFKTYKSILCDSMEEKIFDHEMFREYQVEFVKLTETKNRKKKKQYKALSKEEKEAIEQKELLNYIKLIEKEKFYYYALAYKNQTDVVIVKSPSKNSENKKFLGYEWSSAKGNEGIQYITKSSIDVDDESLDEEDKRILENLQGLKDINTPLYNPKDSEDDTKINKLIKDNFEGITREISDELKKYVTRAKVTDMLDFSRVDFNKALSLSPKNFNPIESKYKQVKISELFLEIKNGKNVKQIDDIGQYRVSRIESIAKGIFDIKATKWTNDKIKDSDFLVYGDILFSHINSVKHLGKTAFFKSKENIVHGVNLLRFRANKEKILSEFAFELFNMLSFTNEIKQQSQKAVNQASVNVEYLSSLKIPLPPLEIQEKIVKECQKVDDEVVEANEVIEQSKENIILTMNSSNENKTIKLGEICELKAGKFISAKDINDENEKDLYPCYGGNGLRGYVKTFTHEGLYALIGRQGALCGNITLVRGKFHATEHALTVTPKIDLDVIWLYHKLVLMDLNQYKTGTAQPGLSVKNINVVNIEVPPLKTQKQIVLKIEKLETKIDEAKKIIDGAKEKKEEILRNYL